MKENWTYKKLGEVAYYPSKRIATKDLKSFSFVGVENLIKDRGGVLFSEAHPNIDTAIEYQKDDILIGNIRPYLKKIWKADKNGGSSGDVVVVRINNEYACLLDAEYLYKVLSTDYFFDYDNSNTKGAKMPRGDRKVIAKYIIPVPPIETQSRIVSELDLLQSIIDKQKAQLKELDNLAQAVFYDMFGDPVENDKGWEVKKLGEVCTFLQGEQVPIEEQFFEKKDGTIRFLRIVDFTQGNEEPRYVYCKDERHILHDNEIAIVRYGTPGFVCYGKFGLIANNLFKVVPKNINFFDFRYLVSWLESSAFQSTVQDNQYGAALQAIKFGTIQNIIIIMPPLFLQQSFAAKIESIEKQKAAINQSIAETQRLFDYTMDKYFG